MKKRLFIRAFTALFIILKLFFAQIFLSSCEVKPPVEAVGEAESELTGAMAETSSKAAETSENISQTASAEQTEKLPPESSSAATSETASAAATAEAKTTETAASSMTAAAITSQAISTAAETAAPLEKYVPQSGPVLPAGVSTVSVAASKAARAEDITRDEINGMVRDVLSRAGFDKVVKNGQTVVIKPNLVQLASYQSGRKLGKEVNGVTTDWRVTEAVLQQTRLLNPDGKIYVMEGSAGGSTQELMDYYNYNKDYMPEADDFIRLEADCGAWQDFNSPFITKVSLPGGLLHKEYYFNKILYDADVVISIPVLKTSSGGVVVTGSIKNVCIGAPPGNIYNLSPNANTKFNMVSHDDLSSGGDIHKWIYDYYMCKPISFAVIDGLQGYQNGPSALSDESDAASKMNMRLIMASSDPVAVDTACAELMGWDPAAIGYFRLFKANGAGASGAERIYIDGGGIGELRKPFEVNLRLPGDTPITDLTPPDFDYTLERLDGGWRINVRASADAVKAEAYSDKLVYYGILNGGSFSFTVADGVGSVRLDVYDAYFNKAEKTVSLG